MRLFTLKRVAVAVIIAFVVVILGLLAFNFYLRSTNEDPGAQPPIIYERSDRPSRA